jgi:hypothetical protein
VTNWQKGDKVHITTPTGQVVYAVVVLASKNGRSLFLEFDAMLHVEGGTYAGGIAVFRDDDGNFRLIGYRNLTPAQASTTTRTTAPLPHAAALTALPRPLIGRRNRRGGWRASRSPTPRHFHGEDRESLGAELVWSWR